MSNSNREQVYGEIQQNKIEYFFRKTGTNDISRAERYLDFCNWDEKNAVQLFVERHPNYKPSVKNNNNEMYQQNPKNFQPIFAPPTQVSRRNKIQPNDKENKNDNYLTFNISDNLYNYTYDNHEPKSETYHYIKKNLNLEKTFISFLKLLRNNKGIIIVFNEDSLARIKEHIKNIKDDNVNLTIFQNCILFPVLNISSIGKEFVQKLSIVSYPTYIFCKYKDDMNLYITDKMEGGFEMTFLINSILKINLESQPSLNIKSAQSHRNNEVKIKDKDKDKNKDKDKDKGHQNKQNENKDSSNLINNLLKDNYFAKNNKKIRNNKLKQNNNDNNNNNRNMKQNLEDDKKIVEPRNQNIQDKSFNNNNNNNNMINIGDIFLGESVDMLKLFNENELYDNANPNLNMNNNNNLINQHMHYNNNDNSNRKEYKNENQNIGKNDNNILADSIYQLTDAQVLQKREREMRELERQQEEKEKKEEEAKKMEIEEEERLDKIKNKYEKEAEDAKKYVPKEPDINNPDACSIIFRVPDGEKNINRRFLKTDKIKVLFNYVKSIGRDIFMEPDSTGFDILCIGFPPKNLEDKKNNTLEEEGLYPNSMLQIREK